MKSGATLGRFVDISGAPERWNNDKLVSEQGSVKGASFEVLRMDRLVTP